MDNIVNKVFDVHVNPAENFIVDYNVDCEPVAKIDPQEDIV